MSDDEPVQLNVTVAALERLPYMVRFEIADGSTRDVPEDPFGSRRILIPTGAVRVLRFIAPPVLAEGSTVTIGKRQ